MTEFLFLAELKMGRDATQSITKLSQSEQFMEQYCSFTLSKNMWWF